MGGGVILAYEIGTGKYNYFKEIDNKDYFIVLKDKYNNISPVIYVDNSLYKELKIGEYIDLNEIFYSYKPNLNRKIKITREEYLGIYQEYYKIKEIYERNKHL